VRLLPIATPSPRPSPGGRGGNGTAPLVPKLELGNEKRRGSYPRLLMVSINVQSAQSVACYFFPLVPKLLLGNAPQPEASLPQDAKPELCEQPDHSKIVDNFARTSSMIATGTPSSLCALREAKSSARGWSHLITPVVFVPAPISDTAKPAVRAKLPPLVIGSTTGVFVRRLKDDGDTTRTGRVPCCSWPEVRSSETR